MWRGYFIRYVLALAVLVGIASPRFCAQDEEQIAGPDGTAEDCPLFPSLRGIFDFKCIQYVEELFKCSLWLLQFLMNAMYSIINTVVVTCFEIASNIFSGVRQIIKLVEFVGYSVRVVLHLNYNFVYSVLTSLQKLLEMLVEGLWKLVQTLISMTISLFRSVIKLLHDIVMVTPKAFRFGYSAAGATKEAVSSLLYDSYLGWKYILAVPGSTLLTMITTTRAVLECLFVTLFNTILLITEFTVNSLIQTYHYMVELAATLSSSAVSAWDSVVDGAQLVSSSTGHFVHTTVCLFLNVIETVVSCFVSLIQAMFQPIYDISHAARRLVVNTSSYGWNTMCSCFTSLLTFFKHFKQGLLVLVRASLDYCTPGGWFILSACLFTLGICPAFGLNPIVYMFEMAEKLVQDVMALMSPRPSVAEEAPVREQRWMGTWSNKEGDTGDLRAELDRERDRHLCVVCQDKPKNMIVMPCRHLCLCPQCSRQLLRLRQWQSRTCPLCRGRITSVLEVYM